MFDTFRYCTVIITIGDTTGTGFLVAFVKDNREEHMIITNNHVVEDLRDHITIYFNLEKNGKPIDHPRYICKLSIKASDIINHPVMDLCGIHLNPHLNYIKTSLSDIINNSNKSELSVEVVPGDVYDIYYKCVYEDIFVNSPLNFIEDILVIGYPLGQHDKFNYTPIYRKGITATDPNLDYNNEPRFLIDCACFPGSSGSPVFTYNITSSRLLGILYETPFINDDNNNYVCPTFENYTRGHLGFVIKANELLFIKEHLFNMLCEAST